MGPFLQLLCLLGGYGCQQKCGGQLMQAATPLSAKKFDSQRGLEGERRVNGRVAGHHRLPVQEARVLLCCVQQAWSFCRCNEVCQPCFPASDASLPPQAHGSQDSWFDSRLPLAVQNRCVAPGRYLKGREQPPATGRERRAPPEQQITPGWYGHHDV